MGLEFIHPMAPEIAAALGICLVFAVGWFGV